jgi:hypothetical protein
LAIAVNFNLSWWRRRYECTLSLSTHDECTFVLDAELIRTGRNFKRTASPRKLIHLNKILHTLFLAAEHITFGHGSSVRYDTTLDQNAGNVNSVETQRAA